MNVFVLLNTREDIFKKFVTRLFWGIIDFHSMKKQHTIEINGAPELLFPTFFRIYCCVQQNKDIQTGSELLEGELMDVTRNFWVNYPFKMSIFSFHIKRSDIVLIILVFCIY